MEQTNDEVLISFQYPVTFNPSCVEYELNERKNSIIVKIPDRVPLVCGLLYDEVSDIKAHYLDGTYVISLKKINQNDWATVVKSVHQNNQAIDPKSAFILYQILASHPNQEEFASIRLSMLFSSSQAGYVPAMQVYGGLLLDTEGKQSDGFSVIKSAADYYEDPVSCFQVGLLYYSAKKFEAAIDYLQRSGDSGFKPAYFSLGQIFSPESSLKFNNKDASRAMEYFMKVDEAAEIPLVYEEMAKLYATGQGVEKDIEKATQLREKANMMKSQQNTIENPNNSIDPSIGPAPEEPLTIPESKEEGPSMRKWVFAGVLAFAGLIGVAVYKNTKKK